MINLERFCGSYSTFSHISDKLCVSNKTKDVNLKVFNIITGLNQTKSLVKHFL